MAFMATIFVLTLAFNFNLSNEITENNESLVKSTAHGTRLASIRCVINKNCSHFYPKTVCIDGHCRCKANYRLNATTNACEYSYCLSDADCQQSGDDSGRMCFGYFGIKRCLCRPGYTENIYNGNKCEKWCLYSEQCELADQVCSDTCKCRTNFRFNATARECQYYECDIDADCWISGDRNRLCQSGTCVCRKDYYEDPVNEICYVSYSRFTSNTAKAWILSMIFIPTISLYCALRYYKQRQRAAAKSPIVFMNTNHNNDDMKTTKLTIQ